MEVDGLPIWAKVGDLDITDEQFKEMESRGVWSYFCIFYLQFGRIAELIIL